MLDMPRPRKAYTQREIDRHGNVRWYFRRGRGKRYRLPGDYGSEEWLKAYDAAVRGEDYAPASRPTTRTLRWLCEKYFTSAAFLNLKPSTQRFRRNVLLGVCQTGGNLMLSQITRTKIAEGRDRRAETPWAAKNYIKVMSYLFEYAVDAGLTQSNPAKGIKHPKAKTKGHQPWTVQEVLKYIEVHPLGTNAYLALCLYLWAGLSRADAWQVGPQHEKNGYLIWDREKTGTPQQIEILDPLRIAIDACPNHQLAYLVTDLGMPFKSGAALGNKFADWCRTAGIKKSGHGLRKLSATLLAENNGTHSELRAMYGWKDDTMPSYYTRSADARKLAKGAGDKLKQSILFPHFVPGEGKKGKNSA
jgi:integrase